MCPSESYRRALEDSKLHHQTSKTFSGKFLLKHCDRVKTIIQKHDIKSILDYGCGKGVQYLAKLKGPEGGDGPTLEEYWGIEVTKYDPAWPAFAKEPEGKFDLVICSHVLGTIPIKDLQDWFVANLFSKAEKAVYLVERVSQPKKDWTKEDCPVGWNALMWLDLLVPLRPKGGPAIYLCVVYPHPSGLVYGVFEF